ncbi:MAG: hypothetical protein F4004_02630 [Acidimicrobiia bacterium]|nr:hypothetical protein [Acidimicrobiia bacterium]
MRATIRTTTSASLLVSGELANQRPTVAVVGKKRRGGNSLSPHDESARRCCKPNSTRPSAALRATIRTTTPLSDSWPPAAADTTATLEAANRHTAATHTRRLTWAGISRRAILGLS